MNAKRWILLRRPAVPVTITRDHLHPTETLRGDDPVREFTVTLHALTPRLGDLVDALKAHGPVANTMRDNPTTWLLHDRRSRKRLAVIESHSGQGAVAVYPVHDTALPITVDAVLHLDRIRLDEVDPTVEREKHHNGLA